jgi:hypothetical protein
MTALQVIEEKGNKAVRRLRKQKFAHGHPFMINSRELERYQCYLEFSNGSICLVELIPSTQEFMTIRQLSLSEADLLRKKYRLEE